VIALFARRRIRLTSLWIRASNGLRAGVLPATVQEVNMARKSVKSSTSKKAAPAADAPERVARDRVITFRISAAEASLIAKAADRVPLARYSRDAVLARAGAEAKAQK
jgi:hypothetical protein